MSTGSALRVFLCHSRADKDRVGELYRRLVADGFAPWLDEEDLLPGQNWRAEIASAVRASDFVLVCLSETSTTRAGYVHKEIKEALDVADEQPEGTIYVIPARLESCELPVRLSHLHAVDLFAEVGYPRLVRAMRNQASAANASRRVVAPAPSTSAAVPSASRRRRVIGLRSALPAPTPSGDRSDATAIGAASSPVAVGPAHPAAPAPSQAAAQAPPAEVARPQAPVYAPTIYVRDPDSGPSGHGRTIRPVYRNDILPTGPRQSLPEATIAAANRIVGESAAVGRNDPCWCGSGKKFKKCHGA